MSYLVCEKRKGSPKVHVEVCQRKCKLAQECKSYKEFTSNLERRRLKDFPACQLRQASYPSFLEEGRFYWSRPFFYPISPHSYWRILRRQRLAVSDLSILLPKVTGMK